MPVLYCVDAVHVGEPWQPWIGKEAKEEEDGSDIAADKDGG